MKQTVVVTGAAGFIGSSLSKLLLKKGFTIIGIDNLTNNYNPSFKKAYIRDFKKFPNFHFYKADILNIKKIEQIFTKTAPHTIIHLAALTGVRNSIKKPRLYFRINVHGSRSIYESAAKTPSVKRFIFASSSSVYGKGTGKAFIETQKRTPASPYAHTKILAEDILRSLEKKHQLPVTIVRLFSVYGPQGRPDMAPYLFTEAAFFGKTIVQYGDGTTARDFTYIDDVLRAFLKLLSMLPFSQTINIGNSSPTTLKQLITCVKKYTKKTLRTHLLPIRKEEAIITFANIDKAKKILTWKPTTSFDKGMKKFIEWFRANRLKQ